VLELRTSPLRERQSDITALARHFARIYANEVGRKPRSFSEEALAAMNRYHWPGNVRELANRVRRGMVMADGRQIEPADLGLLRAARDGETVPTLRESVLVAEKSAIERALAKHPHNMRLAARSLDISRPTLYRLLHKHGLMQHRDASC